VTWAIEQKDYSQWRGPSAGRIEPKTYRYRSRRSGDEQLRQRLRELAAERRRFGYRRLLILLRREGMAANHKRLYRVYTEERLTVRKRGGRKRALGSRSPQHAPAAPGGTRADPLRLSLDGLHGFYRLPTPMPTGDTANQWGLGYRIRWWPGTFRPGSGSIRCRTSRCCAR
jgi:transposase InsO family protein